MLPALRVVPDDERRGLERRIRLLGPIDVTIDEYEVRFPEISERAEGDRETATGREPPIRPGAVERAHLLRPRVVLLDGDDLLAGVDEEPRRVVPAPELEHALWARDLDQLHEDGHVAGAGLVPVPHRDAFSL